MGKYFGPEFDKLYDGWQPWQRRYFIVGVIVICALVFVAVLSLT